MLTEEPWPSGFLRAEQRRGLANILRAFPEEKVAAWIADIDGWCFFYARHTAANSRDNHRELLRKLHCGIKDLSDALEIRLAPHEYADGSFANDDIAESKRRELLNDQFVNARHEARMALGKLTGLIEGELKPFFWRDARGRITHVSPVRPNQRKGGRPPAHMLTHLVYQCARSFEKVFDQRPASTRTGPFYCAMQIVCRAVSSTSSAPDRRISAALEKYNKT